MKEKLFVHVESNAYCAANSISVKLTNNVKMTIVTDTYR